MLDLNQIAGLPNQTKSRLSVGKKLTFCMINLTNSVMFTPESGDTIPQIMDN